MSEAPEIPQGRVLVVDDDAGVCQVLEVFLQRLGYQVRCAANGPEGLKLMGDEPFDVVLADMIMPQMSGLELLTQIKEHHPTVPVIIVTGRPAVEAAVDCIRTGAFDYISKPFDFDKLSQRVGEAVSQHREMTAEVLRTKTIVNLNHRHFFRGYRLLRVLGEGNVGIVFLAEKSEGDDDRKFALKVMQPNLASSPDAGSLPERFLNEAKAAELIDHPNVIRIEEYGRTPDEGIPYIVMDYFEGRPLKAYIATPGSLDLRQKTIVLRQIADALEAVHRKKIVHRDVKPHNILIGEQLDVRLTDFGIARLPNSELTLTSELLGSPAYLAPEAFESSRVDQRADIFSFGVLAYELWLGERPFRASSISLYVHLIQSVSPLEPRRIVPDFPIYLQKMLAKLLKKRASDRYQSMEHVVADLDRWLADAQPRSNFLATISNTFSLDWH